MSIVLRRCKNNVLVVDGSVFPRFRRENVATMTRHSQVFLDFPRLVTPGVADKWLPRFPRTLEADCIRRQEDWGERVEEKRSVERADKGTGERTGRKRETDSGRQRRLP